jgi:RND superfamily putative drug exporter
VLLVVIFGSLVSAGVPLALGAFAMVMALTVLRVLAAFTDVSIFAVNIVSVLGLGLAIDYSLFILNRYREELPGRSPEQALTVAMSTTGRAVAFSGVTVAISLLGLFLFPQMFLRSMALGGIAVTLGAVLVSLTLLPALIAALGSNIDALRVPGFGRSRASGEGRFWHRVAFGVMRRPVMVAVVVVGILLVFASPFLRFQGSIPDHRVLGRQTEARHVSESFDAQFTPHMTTPHGSSSRRTTERPVSAEHRRPLRLRARRPGRTGRDAGRQHLRPRAGPDQGAVRSALQPARGGTRPETRGGYARVRTGRHGAGLGAEHVRHR